MIIVGDAGDAIEDFAPAQKEKRAKTERARRTGTVRQRHAQSALPDAADGVGHEAATEGQAATVTTRSVHPKSFNWGAAMFTFKAPRSYQVRCPRICTHRHASGKITACTKTRSFSSPADEALVIRQLKFWVSQARDYSSRKDHMEKCPFLKPPSHEELESSKLPSDYETEDEDLRPVAKKRRVRRNPDAEAEAPDPKAGQTAKARAKAKMTSRAKAKSRSGRPKSSSSSKSRGSSSDSDSSSTSSSSSSSSGSTS